MRALAFNLTRRAVLLVSLAALLSPAAFATANNCGTPAGTGPGFANPSTPVTLATATNVLGSGLGCQVIDSVFSGWAVQTPTVSGCTADAAGCLTEADSAAEINVLGTLQTGTAATPSIIRLTFTPTTAAWWNWDPDDSGFPDGTLTNVIDFVMTIDQTSFPGGRTYAMRAGFNYSNLDNANIGNYDDASVSVAVCHGGTPAPCTSGVDQTFTRSILTNSAGFDYSIAVASGAPTTWMSFTTPQSSLSFRTTLTITDNSSNGLNLSGFYLEFQETPEPSSVLLLSCGLAGLALLGRFSKRSRA